MLIRIFDIFFSFLALVFLSPLLILIAFFLKITGEGEILYFQKRVGLDEMEFNLIKFATMMKNSENLGSGTITIDNDFRILPFGKILRKTKINELPQIFNVLKGDMSFIGPRPIVKSEIKKYGKNFKKAFSVKPGISGLWQVSGRNKLSYNKRIELDIFYSENMTLILDIKIFIKTIIIILFPFGKGAY